MTLSMELSQIVLILVTCSSSARASECSAERCGQDFLPWTNLTQLTQLEQTETFSMKVIVLTMNRPESLLRLLRSINNTYFEHDTDSIEVEIHVDKSHGWLYEDCVKIAHNFTLPKNRGRVTARIAERNHGLRTAWFDSGWPKTDQEHAIIVEDDLELAPTWFSWLRKAWLSYRHRGDVAGITLSRQFLMFKKPEKNVEILNDHQPFLYKLVGTWALSPHPARWREFLTWFRSKDSETFDPYVPGLITSDWLHMHTWQGRRHMTWEQWHIYYSEHNNLFTMYINLPNWEVLANNWSEAGVHSKTSPNKPDFSLAKGCPIQLQEFPETLRKFDWDTMEIS